MSRGSMERSAPGEAGINIANAYFHQDLVRTPVTSAFTSNHNVRYLMESLIQGVQRSTGILIGPQSIQEMATIMKQVYMSSGPYLVHLPDLEVERLNRSVLQRTIHEVSQAVQSYKRYLDDSFSQPVPPDRPMNVNTKGSRQFEINYFL